MKYTDDMIKQAKSLFPENREMHEMMRSGDIKVVELLHSKLGFHFDEDDVIKAFRNKKEFKVLEMAKRAKAIRELYQKVFFHVEASEYEKAEKNGYGDCV